jgi:hypothetical protein
MIQKFKNSKKYFSQIPADSSADHADFKSGSPNLRETKRFKDSMIQKFKETKRFKDS